MPRTFLLSAALAGAAAAVAAIDDVTSFFRDLAKSGAYTLVQKQRAACITC